jgi:hypothetical protein
LDNRGREGRDCTVHGEALAVVPAHVLADEVLKVLVWLVDVADLVVFVDEVTVMVS